MRAIAFLTILAFSLLSLRCSESIENIYILPENYEGVVVIFHEIENGEYIPCEEGKQVHVIKDNGVLILKNPFCENCTSFKYFYKNQNPKNELEYCWGCKLKSRKPMVYGGSTGIYNSGEKSFKCTIFIVGTKSNEDSLTRVRDNLNVNELYEKNKL